MKTALFFSVALSLGLTASARAQTAPADTACSYKNHLGLTASPQLDDFFTANRSLPIGLIYRRQTAPNRTTRYRVVGRYDFNDVNPPALSSSHYREHAGNIELALGREWWLPIGRRVAAYAGAEVGGRLQFYQKDFTSYATLPFFNPGLPPTSAVAETIGRETRAKQGVFFRAVAGVRLRVSRRLYAEVEAGIPVEFSREQYDINANGFFVNTNIPTGTNPSITGLNTFYSVTTQFQPISRLHLVFFF